MTQISTDPFTNATSQHQTQVEPDTLAEGNMIVSAFQSGRFAHLALTYYYYPDAVCSFTTCALEVGTVSSTNGGATWSAPTRLDPGPMALSWLAATTQGYMVGDYPLQFVRRRAGRRCPRPGHGTHRLVPRIDVRRGSAVGSGLTLQRLREPPMSTSRPDSPIDGAAAPPDGGVPRRKCSRCQLMFAGDPTLDNGGMPEWWLCPPCRSNLLARTSS